MDGRVVFHVDFDYFYAQCEEVRDPGLRTRPVCVCVYSERGGDSGAVATANYRAREFGARSGIPISRAKRALEGQDAAFLPVDFDYYSGISDAAMKIMRGHADVFEYVGRDEAYLDVTARTGGDYGRAAHLGQQLKNAVRSGTGLSCSVGISPNKLVSKIASDHKKPDGLTVVPPDGVGGFLAGMPVRAIPGIGGKTAGRLAEMGLETIADARRADIFELNREFGRRGGAFIHNAAMGKDDDPVREREPSVQFSRITTLRRDSGDYEFLAASLPGLCRDVHGAASGRGVSFRTVGVHLVGSDLSSRSRSRTLRSPSSSLADLERTAAQLLREALGGQKTAVRRLGVRVSELTEARGQRGITDYF